MHSVMTCDPANIEYALKSNFANYPKGIHFQNLFRDLLGEGIVNADSKSWRLQRKIASLEFNSRSFRDFTASTVEEMVEKRLVPLLADAAERGTAIDLQDVFLRYTFDNTCSLVFGRNPGCLAVHLPVILFAKAFDDAVEATLYRHVMPRTCWKLFRLLKVGKERQFHRALKPLKDFVDDLIAYKKSVIANAGESISESKDLPNFTRTHVRSFLETLRLLTRRPLCIGRIYDAQATISLLCSRTCLTDLHPSSDMQPP